MEASGRDLLGRVVEQAGGQAVLEALADRLSGADLTSLLLEVMRRRTDRVSPADVLRQYRQDRFVAPSDIDLREFRRVEDAMFGALPDGFDVLALAPLVPLGAHSAVATVDPRKVIATVRRTEVAADPTNALALEAAVRRRRLLASPAGVAEAVRLATSQRVTRAALFSGPVSFSHFQLFGLVTAGRDTGGRQFERRSLLEHLRIGATGLRAAGAASVTLALTSLDEVGEVLIGTVREEFSGWPGVAVAEAPEREDGRGYYYCLCFKIFARFAGGEGEELEVSDGGFTDWTAQLLGSRKERLLISGHGLDRVAIMATQRSMP
jgi:hypothetical protein